MMMMMKSSVFIAVTVDGFIATPDGDVGFLDQYHHTPPKANKYDFESFMKTVDILIMGRKSFEKVLSFGPEMWAYGETPVVVLTRKDPQDFTSKIPAHLQKQVTCSAKPPSELVAELSEKGYKQAYIDGGQTIQGFLRAGLVGQLI